MLIIADIELKPPIHTAPIDLVTRLTPWLLLACATVLFVAAFLHWKRTRHRYLLALAAASISVALGAIANLVFRMAPPIKTLPSGTIRLDTRLATIGAWSLLIGLVIGIVGGIGAIRCALRSRRHTEAFRVKADAEPSDATERSTAG